MRIKYRERAARAIALRSALPSRRPPRVENTFKAPPVYALTGVDVIAPVEVPRAIAPQHFSIIPGGRKGDQLCNRVFRPIVNDEGVEELIPTNNFKVRLLDSRDGEEIRVSVNKSKGALTLKGCSFSITFPEREVHHKRTIIRQRRAMIVDDVTRPTKIEAIKEASLCYAQCTSRLTQMCGAETARIVMQAMRDATGL